MHAEFAQPSSYDAQQRALILETRGGTALRRPSAHPRFFDGFVVYPSVVAEGIVQLAAVAASAYNRSRPTSAGGGGGGGYDPVVTSDGRQLRLESFSQCAGVQARLDVLSEGLDGAVLDIGTTNIDVNEPLRRMLSAFGSGDFLHLAIGSDEVVATTATSTAAETRIPLSARWVRAFGESQRISADFEPRMELPALDAMRFLATVGTRASGWVVQARGAWRISARPTPGSVFLSGADRLESLLPLLSHGSVLRAYGPAVSATSREEPSAWEIVLPGGRFVLTLSADAMRGFSGEGALLNDLASEGVLDDAEAVAALLSYEIVAPGELAQTLRLPLDRVRAALACLAAVGRVGYDVCEAAYFHRDLPYDAARLGTLNPRLRAAEELVAAGAVTPVDSAVTEVRSEASLHRVRRREDGSYACTCEWWGRHRGERGPCKHVLATTMMPQTGSASGAGE